VVFVVPAPVVQHVRERVTRLPRLADRRRVVAVGEDAPAPRHAAVLRHERVQPLRRRDAQRPHAIGQRDAVVGLAQQVDVVPLDRQVHHAKAGAPGQHQRDHRQPHRGVRLGPPQPTHLVRHAQDHMHRQPPVVERPRAMRALRRPRQRPLATGALPPAAMTGRLAARLPRRRIGPRQPELRRLPRARPPLRHRLHRHLDWANITTTTQKARQDRRRGVDFGDA
jgi:hypothetical protein